MLTYGNEVWTPSNLNKKRLEKEQMRAARFILGFPTSSKVPGVVLRAELGWLPIEATADIACMRFFAKIMRMGPERLVRKGV